jgi:hypothetical protein
VGAGVGAVGGVAAGVLVFEAFPETTYNGEIILPLAAIVSATIVTGTAMSVGVYVGVFLVGNIGNETGSLQATGNGSILGLFGGIAGSVVVAILSDGLPDIFLIVGPAIGATIGATIGFNMTRRYKSLPASKNVLINFSDGQMSLAIPTVSFQPDPYVGLVRVRF